MTRLCLQMVKKTKKQKKDHSFEWSFDSLIDGLEYERELSTRHFFRIVFTIVIFPIACKGLHDAEHCVLSEGIVDTNTPCFNVVVVIPTPTICGTVKECTVFSVDVFNPCIPGLRSCIGSLPILELHLHRRHLNLHL